MTLPDRPRATGYPLEGRLEFQGLQISIENAAGSVRSGTNPDGSTWSTTMVYPYGYIRGTQGVDGDHLDCFVGPNPNAHTAYVIDCLSPDTGVFDEHKVMLGFDTEQSAVEAFLLHYDSPQFLGPVRPLDMDTFRGLVLHRENWGQRISKADADGTPLLRAVTAMPPGVTQTVNPENTSTSVMVCVALPAAVAEQIAVPGGLPASTLHVTLAFLGKAEALPPQRLQDAITQLAWAARTLGPIAATINGSGRFQTPKGDACWVSVDTPAFEPLRAIILRVLAQHELEVSSEHGFIPHVTVAYVDSGAPHPRETVTQLAFRFEALEVWAGNRQYQLPLGQESMLAKAVQAQADPVAQARTLLAQLTGDLIHVHRTQRRIAQAASSLHDHHNQARDGLGAGVRGVRGSDLEDATLHHAEEAATARRLGAVL